MIKLNIVGSALVGTSGYSVHTKNLFKALAEEITDIHLDVPRPPGWELQVTDQELKCMNTPRFNDGITLMIAMPQFWAAALVEPSNKFIGFAVWEGNKVPQHWKKPLQDVDAIAVPSIHTRDAILNTFPELKTPITIIPHGVDSSLFTVQDSPKKEGTPFVFSANKGFAKGINDRGGVQYLLKAFSEEFSAEENVQLRLKINAAYCPPGWNLQQELEKLQLDKDRPQIHISTDSVPYRLIPQFYQGTNCFISPSMGEAFSIPCLEAMSMNLPVITTNYSGPLDYLDETCAWLIDYDMVEVTWDQEYEGISWARPRVKHLRELMRYAFENPEECKSKGTAGRLIAEKWSWESSAKKLIDFVTSI